nr:hypothetical protein [Tanacetum cinerariifolium]
MIKPSQPIPLENDNNPQVLPILLLPRLGYENPIRTLEDYSKPSHEGYRNTIELPIRNNVGKNTPAFFNFPFAIKLAIGLNAFPQDPSPHGRILLLDSLLNSFHQEGPQNSATIS